MRYTSTLYPKRPGGRSSGHLWGRVGVPQCAEYEWGSGTQFQHTCLADGVSVRGSPRQPTLCGSVSIRCSAWLIGVARCPSIETSAIRRLP